MECGAQAGHLARRSLKKSVPIVFICLIQIHGVLAQLLPDQRKGEWHVLLIAATANPNAGNANQASLEQATQNFELIASTLGIKLFIHKITGDSLSKESVKEGIRELLAVQKTGSGRLMATVMSFTHGMNFPDTWTRLPFMVCHPRESGLEAKQHLIAIEDIYQTLRTFGRFDHIHVWAELCNNIPYGLEEKAPLSQPLSYSSPAQGLMYAKSRLERLLMQEEAMVMVSSQYGQVSYTFKEGGGLFTNSLFLGMEKVANGEVESMLTGRKGFFSFVKAETQRHVNMLAGSLRRQSPQCFVGDVPNSLPPPESNIIKAYDQYNRQTSPVNNKKPKQPPSKTPMDILKEIWSPK